MVNMCEYSLIIKLRVQHILVLSLKCNNRQQRYSVDALTMGMQPDHQTAGYAISLAAADAGGRC